MGYRIRVLANTTKFPSVARFRELLEYEGFAASLEVTGGTEVRWTQFVLWHTDKTPIASIERDPVTPGSLGEGELAEYIEEVKECEPASAASWLIGYLPRIKAIYAIQILSGADQGDGWNVIHAIQNDIWQTAGGILQADLEGFSNEEGYHILWQFSDSANGEWKMAVHDENDRWVSFIMDLWNSEHREAFKLGKVPEGVKHI